MPFPVVVALGVMGAAAAGGAWKIVRAGLDVRGANTTCDKATGRHREAVAALEAERVTTLQHAESFASHKRDLVETALEPVLEFLRDIQREGELRGLNTLTDIGITPEQFQSTKVSLVELKTAFEGLGSATAAAVGASQAAVATAALVGTASTGTAIASLSGAAATNATLAWLGGGALAAGGGGMALGAAVLGGIAVAPAVVVAGFILGTKAQKALTNAQAYVARVDTACADCKRLVEILGEMRRRMDEIVDVANRMADRLHAALKVLRAKTWVDGDDDLLKKLHTTIVLAGALAEVLRAPILSEDGTLSSDSAEVTMKYRDLLG